MVESAVKNNGFAVQYASKRLKGDVDIAIMAVDHTDARTSIFERRTRANGPYSKALLPAMQKNKNVLMTALSVGGIALDSDFVPLTMRADVDIVVAAISFDASQLQHANTAAWNHKVYEKLCERAIECNGAAMRYVSKELRERDGFIQNLRRGSGGTSSGYTGSKLADSFASSAMRTEMTKLVKRREWKQEQQRWRFTFDVGDDAEIEIVHADGSCATLSLAGPLHSPYYTGQFEIDCCFPEDFPHTSPLYRFITKIFHPAVGAVDGIVQMTELRTEKWSPSKGAFLSFSHSLYSNPPSPNALPPALSFSLPLALALDLRSSLVPYNSRHNEHHQSLFFLFCFGKASALLKRTWSSSLML